jgi:2-polyprenyl-3-methyl-5-hydroxy-6-metoxy-1,4-benzoquinol methylase
MTYDERLSIALQDEYACLLDSSGAEFNSSKIQILNQCPVCCGKDYSIYCIKDKFVHKTCKNCGLVYLDPKLNRDTTLNFYNSKANEIYNEQKFHLVDTVFPDDIENLHNYNLLLENIKDKVYKGKKILEIGPGRGTFLAKAVEDGFEAYAVELNSLLIENLKKITNNVYTDDILNIELPENFFDAIYFRDVMEHIDLPMLFLNKIQSVLKPGGILLIDTHNINSIVNSATKEFHTVIFAFEHPLHWSPKSLSFAGEKAGLIYKKTYFIHLHQSLYVIVHNYLIPSFTYIYPPKQAKAAKLFYKILAITLNLPVIKSIDSVASILISKLFGKGSKMQMVFTKK